MTSDSKKARTLKMADDVFEKLERCLHNNFADDEQRYEAEHFVLHKLIWSMTVNNELAHEMLAKVKRHRVYGDRYMEFVTREDI